MLRRRSRISIRLGLGLAATALLGSTLLHAMPDRYANAIGVRLLDPLTRRFDLHPLEPLEHYTGIIVPGGSAQRLHEAGRLARTYSHLKIFVTGAGTPDQVKRELPDGITADRIEIDELAKTTYQNAFFSALLLKPESNQRWLLVTSAHHMPRAMGSFRQAGFQVTPWPVDDIPKDFTQTYQIARHEWLGLAAYRLFGRSSALFPASKE